MNFLEQIELPIAMQSSAKTRKETPARSTFVFHSWKKQKTKAFRLLAARLTANYQHNQIYGGRTEGWLTKSRAVFSYWNKCCTVAGRCPPPFLPLIILKSNAQPPPLYPRHRQYVLLFIAPLIPLLHLKVNEFYPLSFFFVFPFSVIIFLKLKCNIKVERRRDGYSAFDSIKRKKTNKQTNDSLCNVTTLLCHCERLDESIRWQVGSQTYRTLSGLPTTCMIM